jgi:hypothetical protein
MIIKVHARNIDPMLRDALRTMTQFTLEHLIKSKHTLNSLKINIHLKHHDENGEAIPSKHANKYRPRSFEVYLDHHRMLHDDYDRVRDDTEWGHEILRTLGHELVHVKDYVSGVLNWKNDLLYYKGKHYDCDNLIDYFDLPYEVEAYGRERGLLVSFLYYWSTLPQAYEYEMDAK